MRMLDTVIHLLFIGLVPPLLIGIIGKTKAWFAGRIGPPFLQPYYDIIRLFRKGSVFSTTTTWVFRAGPAVTLVSTIFAALLIPFGHHPAPISFNGDVILFAYLFALGRFFTTIAALDTGSSFEGMGAAREVTFSALAEPALFFALITLARLSGTTSLTSMLNFLSPQIWLQAGASLLLLVSGVFVVLLAENCRVPFDDPNTHLELTMIHEVMVLDHSGPLLGTILYAAAIKLLVIGALFIDIVAPFSAGSTFANWGIFFGITVILAILVGTVESIMARLRLKSVPQLLVASAILTAFSLLMVLR